MDREKHNSIPNDNDYPVLSISKNHSSIQFDRKKTNNMFLRLKIFSLDGQDVEQPLYSGFCNVNIVEPGNTSIQSSLENVQTVEYKELKGLDSETLQWIDSLVPFEYNQSNMCNNEGSSSNYQQTLNSLVTAEQHNTFIAENIYNDSISEDMRILETNGIDHENITLDEIALDLFKDDFNYSDLLPEISSSTSSGHGSKDILSGLNKSITKGKESNSNKATKRKCIEEKTEGSTLKKIVVTKSMPNEKNSVDSKQHYGKDFSIIERIAAANKNHEFSVDNHGPNQN